MALRSLFSGISGLQTHQVRLDVISNNIANVNTTAFKASRVRFEDILSQTTEIATAPESGRGGQNPVQVGLGVTGASIQRDMRQGSIETTGRSTDLAIQGNGFFVLRNGESVAEYYSRDGSFEVDADGDLVKASNGYRVQGWNSAYDSVAREWAVDTSQPVSDVNIDLFQQFQATATSSVEFAGNLDSRAETALDPLQVAWTKNGVERTVEMRFTHVDPTRNLYLWRLYDTATIDTTTGDFQLISTDAAGTEASGIFQIDSDGRISRHFINTADDDATDPADYFLNLASATEAPSAPDLWAVARPGSSFNGYDYITLSTEGDTNNFITETNTAVTSDASIAETDNAGVTADVVTITLPNAPFSSQAGQAGSAYATNGFAADAVFQAGTPNGGTAALAADGLGIPVQFLEGRANQIATKRINVGGNTVVQLPDDLIVSLTRANPTLNGDLAANPTGATPTALLGSDGNSIEVYIDGRQYTEISAATAFTANSAQFKLDSVNGIVTVNGTVAAGVNIIVNYDTEIRPRNTWSTANGGAGLFAPTNISEVTADTGGFNATKTLPDGTTMTTGVAAQRFDGSVFYVPGSAGSMSITEAVGPNGTQTFTEVPYRNPQGGAAIAPGAQQYTINPETGAITYGTFSNGNAVDTAADTIAVGWSFEAYRGTRNNKSTGAAISGLTNQDHSAGGTDNAHGFNDLWRFLSLPVNGAETGQANLYLQGDGAGVDPGELDAEHATLAFRPTLGTTVTGTVRAEVNYESDDRVNLIIPNGLTKTPNVNPLTDLTPETFSITPNINQITGNNGNNNQADSGDSVVVDIKPAGDYQYTTAIQVYDTLGEPHNLTFKYERLDRNLWLVSAPDPTDATGQRLAGYRILAFDADGRYDAANTIPYMSPSASGTTSSSFTGFYFDPPQAGGAAPPQEGADPLSITPDFTNLVQTGTSSDATIASQDGAPPGDLESFSFNSQGFVVALFDNGRTRNLARVALQNFVNPAGLLSVGANMFRETLNSGKIGSPSRPGIDGVGELMAGALEASNVDLSVEFVDLIITQRGFQAQSRSITTADQVLQEVLSLKR